MCPIKKKNYIELLSNILTGYLDKEKFISELERCLTFHQMNGIKACVSATRALVSAVR